MFQVPIALVSLVDRDRIWFKGKLGVDDDETPRHLTFCSHTILGPDVLVVPDAQADRRFAASPLVAGEPGFRFYAGAPLVLEPGPALGAFCVVDRRPRSFSPREQRLLRQLADVVVGQLERHRARVEAEARAVELDLGEERLRLALAATGAGVWELLWPGGELTLSGEARSLLGLGPGGPVGLQMLLERVSPRDRRKVRRLLRPSGRPDRTDSAELRFSRFGDAKERWLALSGRSVGTRDGARRFIGAVQDVTDRKSKQRALAESEERLRLALQAGRAVAWERAMSEDWVTRSENAPDILGIGSGPFREYLDRVHPEDRPRLADPVRYLSERDSIEFRFFPPGRPMIWLAVRGVLRSDELGRKRFLGLTFDITAAKAAADEVWRAAHHDPLTGLPNRKLFLQRLEEAMARAREAGRDVSLLLLDLDEFKDVNDTLGHGGGDELLVRVAHILRADLRSGEAVARLGGDEFALALEHDAGAEAPRRRGQEVLRALRTTFQYEGQVFEPRASVGIATAGPESAAPIELMKDADLALYRAKAEWRNRAVLFSPELRRGREERLRLAQEVRRALEDGRILPFYQPKVSLATGLVAGFEALARWDHPHRGLLTAGVFGTVFEDPDIAFAISERMLRSVAADLRRWDELGLPCGRVAVNCCAADFRRGGVASRILRGLRENGIAPNRLEIEVTETVLLGRTADAVKAELVALHDTGVTVALDDFGTGFASLTHLKQFPVDNVKIDRSFVAGLGQNAGDEAIVSAVIGLGRGLGMQVTAEGVETAEQVAFLVERGCDDAQGWWYAKAMEAAAVPGFMAAWTRQTAAAA